MGQDLHICVYERCGKSFAAPVRLTDLSHKPRSETYYACPYCFSKMEECDTDLHSELRLIKTGSYPIGIEDSKTNVKAGGHKDPEGESSVVSCPHHVGYLKTRSRDQAVPDVCLTCSKILQCMV